LDSVSFLGDVISSKGVSVDPKKVKAVIEWGRPTSVHEIGSFLELASYYHHFIEGFPKVSGPLTSFKRKKARYFWTDACEESLRELKRRLESAPVLTVPTECENFVVYSDASKK
jgi:hypothetical protein